MIHGARSGCVGPAAFLAGIGSVHLRGNVRSQAADASSAATPQAFRNVLLVTSGSRALQLLTEWVCAYRLGASGSGAAGR
jgi:hypothetical protein